MRKKLLLGFSIFLIGFGTAYFGLIFATDKLADGFLESHIYSTLKPDPKWKVENHSYPQEIFEQPYHYLSRGSQNYVFESEDGLYVIKFFRHNRFRTSNFCCGPSFLQEMQKSSLEEKTAKQLELFSSCHLAFCKLREECGLIYMHLNKSHHLNKRLLIYDRLKRGYVVNLDEVEFFIQKRAEPLMQRLSHADTQKSMEAIALLIKKRIEKGIDDHDPVLQKNTGFVGNQPIFLDIGSFYQNAAINKDYYQVVFQMTRKLQRLLSQKDPKLGAAVDNSLKTLI